MAAVIAGRSASRKAYGLGKTLSGQWRFAQQYCSVTALDDLLKAALRGENPARTDEPERRDVFLSRASFHGVGPLLYSRITPGLWPDELARRLRDKAVQSAMWELAHQQALTTAFAALAAQGIHPIIIKGTALAYSLYGDASLRTRGDTDMIIAPTQRERVDELLLLLGYERNNGVSGEHVSYQASYTRKFPNAGLHTIDLHWKINNSEVISRLFTYEELLEKSQPLPSLSADARRTSHVHALLIACMHRCTHRDNPYYVDGAAHYESDRLIWLADIDLLARELNGAEWEEFLWMAQRKGLRSVCLDGLQTTRAALGTHFPCGVLDVLSRKGDAELPAAYFSAGKLRRHWMDWVALGTLSCRLQFLRESAFPSAAYMRRRFAQPAGLLPWLYLRRLFTGLAKRLAGHRVP